MSSLPSPPFPGTRERRPAIGRDIDAATREGAAYLMEKAARIAQSLELGSAVRRGELPVRSVAP